MHRLHTFDEVLGHKWLITYLKNKLSNGTFPHFVIIDGDEGLGKTTLADLIALHLVYGNEIPDNIMKAVVDEKKSTDKIKKFVMSVEGGKDAAKNVLAEMTTTFNEDTRKVIILDECHGMSEAAQDVFLSDTEYVNDNVYIIMLTTEIQSLKPTLRSRAVPIHLMPLKTSDMMKVLQREVDERQLTIQGGEHTLKMIAEWAENKPRTGLSILSAFDKNSNVSEVMIQEFIGYLSIDDVLQLCKMLSGSMVHGLDYISEMTISQSIIPIVTEFIKIKTGFHSYKIKFEDIHHVNELLIDVESDQLVKFLYGLTSRPKITRSLLMNSFIRAHKNYETIKDETSFEVLEAEKIQKANQTEINNMSAPAELKAITIEELLSKGTILGDS